METHLHADIDTRRKAHRRGIACSGSSILEESGIAHAEAGFQESVRDAVRRGRNLSFPVAVTMEGFKGYAHPPDRLILDGHCRRCRRSRSSVHLRSSSPT